MDIPGFLRHHPPFDALEPERLEAVAGSVEIEHVPEGTVVLQQGGAPASHLYVVRKGAVELLDDGRLLDLLGEGEVFGQFSLLAHEGPTVTVRAHEDTLCYLIPEEVADELLETSAGQAFVIGSMRRRILSASERSFSEGPDARLAPIGTLVRRPAVSAEPTTTVSAAAERMADERVSSLLVPMRGGWGIVTDRDLRTRVVAVRESFDTPVEAVATFPAMTLEAQTPAGEALLRMFADGVHHFPVTDVDGAVTGIVTDTDLMGLTRHSPFAIKSAIERAATSEEVAEAGRDLPQVVVAMVDVSADPVDVGRVVALVVDTMTERLLQLGVAAQGDPPCAWAWLALGSAARHEQALKTDQDHALAFDPDGEDPATVDPYFARLAEFVTAGLEAGGIPRCHGDAMAVHSALRKPIDGWVETFRSWLDDPDPTASILASIGYDFRQVAGPLDAEPSLDDALRQARGHPSFLRHLGRRALDLKPPTGFFRDLVVEHQGEHAGRLDVKHGGISIINNLARAYSTQAGVTAKGTLSRLQAAVLAGVLDADVADELSEAFHFLWGVRLEHQTAQVRSGEAPDDFVDPAELGPLARSGLKEAFRVDLPGAADACERSGRHPALGLLRLDPDGMESTVDVDQLAADAPREVREQERDRLAYRRGIGDVPAEGRAGGPPVGDGVEARDALAGHRLERTRAHGVHADALRPQVACQVARDGLEPGLGNPHPVVDGPGDAGVEVERDDGASRGFHQRQEAHRQLLERERAGLHRRRHRFPGRVEEVPPQGVLRRERDRVQEPVHRPPAAGELAADAVDLCGIVHVHLQHVGGIGQPLRALLGESHPSTHARQDDLGALLLRHVCGGERDGMRREHAGDQEALLLEQHEGLLTWWASRWASTMTLLPLPRASS